MIVARSPLRISLGGGGTDLPSYYRERGGFLVAAAIDKYVYITVNRTFVPYMIVKYSRTERVRRREEIKHPIVREALKLLDFKELNVEITSMADIPAGTGLGSSGSFGTALLKALHAYRGESLAAGRLADKACRIELDVLKEPIGKQDQYAASFGGINAYSFGRDGSVKVRPVKLRKESLRALQENLVLYFTGYSRRASVLLQHQDARSRRKDREMLSNLDQVKESGHASLKALEAGDMRGFAGLMTEQWLLKRGRDQAMTNRRIDSWHALGLANGAWGGKLVGAGGGGFLMFFTEDHKRLSRAMAEAGLAEVRFKFDFEGTRIV